MTEAGLYCLPAQRMTGVNWFYPLVRSGYREERDGSAMSHHLQVSAESISMNVGGPYAERCSPAMNHRGVGGPIVVGARESRAQGEGGQGIDAPSTH
jgi:hypothetical protein